jgi:TorA maturation chaperone TorD
MVQGRGPLMDAATLAGVAARRSELYWLLAELALTCPDGAFVARLRGDLARVTGTLEPGHKSADLSELGGVLAQIADATDITALAVEYTRLFGSVKLGHGLPPPYESVHRNAAAASEIGLAVMRHYASAGLDPADAGSPPDHLGVELKFLALLCYAECAAWRDRRKVEALQTLAAERGFLDEHLLQWAPRYWEQARAESRHDFYRKLAGCAQNSLDEDRAMINRIQLEAEAA